MRMMGIAVCLALTGCAAHHEYRVMPEAGAVGAVHSVYVATTRGINAETGRPDGTRDAEERFSRLDISIPPERALGEITWPPRRGPVDPAKHFLTVQHAAFPDARSFRGDFARALHQQPPGAREAVVFIHGFNTTFSEGAYRIAQLSHDMRLPGVVAHYSWPSFGSPLGYVYDGDSALFARDGLEQLLHELHHAGAERTVIVAHSMGSLLAMETLRQIAIAGDRHILDRIGGVMLISPDIDVEVFRMQAERIGTLPDPFIIFTSKRDEVLRLSARLTGQKDRLGTMTDIQEVGELKLTLLDVSAFTDGRAHFTVGTSPALLRLSSSLPEVYRAFALDPAGRTDLLTGTVLTVRNATEIVLHPVASLADGLAQ